jgi:uncharacterized membrane protein
VTARSLLLVFDSAYVLALTAWVGSILFFSFVVAPIIFQVLSAESAARFVRALFPRYYAWGAISGAIALPSYLGVPLSFDEYRGPTVAVQSLAIITGILIMLYAGNSLTPAINAARDAGAAGEARFRRLHRRSVWLNAVALLLGIALLIAFATRAKPKTRGIEELSPTERARYDVGIEKIIEAIEVERGLRPAPKGAIDASKFDPAVVKEINEYYDRKYGRSRPPAEPSRGSPSER